MKKYVPLLITIGLLWIGSLIWFRNKFPKTIEKQSIPIIITKVDTVQTIPKWLIDSLSRLSKTTATTDTVQLWETRTIIKTDTLRDTIFIDVKAGNIQPILTLTTGKEFGDTGFVHTINVNTGEQAVSRFFTPGFLRAIEASDSTPRLFFEPFKVDTVTRRKSNLLSLLIAGSIGYTACSIKGN